MDPRFANIPDELKARPQWVVWRKVERDGKATKVPFTADLTGRHASTTDPSTWSSYEVAVAASKRFDGIGYVFSPDDPYTGIDWDCCLDGGEVLEWAADKIAAFCPSYAEISPSGKGVKAIVRAKLPGSGTRRNGFGGDRAGAVEMYDHARYFTITGDRWSDSECECLDRQAAVDALYREIHAGGKAEGMAAPVVDEAGDWRPPTAALSDAEIVAKLIARGSKALDPDVQTFRDLYQNGDLTRVHDDDSAADFALSKILAKWVGDDPARIERIFSGSALAERDKWRGRPTYRLGTIRKAIDSARTTPDLSPKSVLSLMEEEFGQPIVGVRSTVPPFPLDVFPAKLALLCRQASASIHVSADYLGALALGVAGAAAGQSTTLCLRGSWEEAGNLYLGIMGEPGTKKSPALKLMAAPLWAIDKDLRKEAKARHEEWQRDKKAADRAGESFPDEEPPRRRLVTDDATKEVLARMLQANPRGMVLIKDELTSLVASLNAYRGGKGDDLQFYLKLNTRSAVAVDRVKDIDNPIVVVSPCLSILGCMTPGTVSSLVETRADNGWVDRFLFAYPDGVAIPPEWANHAEVEPSLKERWRIAIRHIHAFPGDTSENGYEPIRVHLSDSGRVVWSQLYDTHNAEMYHPDFPRGLRGPWSKLEGFAARFALILSLLRVAYAERPAPRGPVEAEDVHGAAVLLEYFKACFRRVHDELAGRVVDADDDTAEVIRWLRVDRVDSFTARDVLRKFRWMTTRRRDVILAWLRDRHYIRPMPSESREGRPSLSFQTNPSIRDRTDFGDKSGFVPNYTRIKTPDIDDDARSRRVDRWLTQCLATAPSHPSADVLRWGVGAGFDESELRASMARNADVFRETEVAGMPHWSYDEEP